MNFKFTALVLLSLAAFALAGPTGTNNIDNKTPNPTNLKDITETVKSPAAETLKQWCQTSQLSQPELTESFKKLVSQLKQSPSDELTDAVVINPHVCQTTQDADMDADDLVKDVYMDALSACDKRECLKQLVKCIESGKVDNIRANYYMTRLAVADRQSASEQKDMIQELSESFVQPEGKQSLVNMAIQRQKMFAVTANLAKQIKKEMENGQSWEQVPAELKQTTERVIRAINDRFIKPVTQQEVEEYKQKAKTPAHLAQKMAERSAAMKAIANVPGYVIEHITDVQQTLVELIKNKQELSTVRQSAIEALEQSEQAAPIMSEIAFEQHEEPTEVRVAAYRCLMTTAFAQQGKDEPAKQQKAQEIIAKVITFAENQQNQQQDQQFCLYVVSHLDNLRKSENPDHAAIKEAIHANKQHHMQISLLNRKFKHQLQKFGKSSRNFQLDQTYDKIESGLVVDGDLVFGQEAQQQISFLPKLVRVNVSLPILGQTVNVIEVAVRQNNMEQEFVHALRPLQGAKFNAEAIEKVVGEFKQQINEQQQRQQQQQQQPGMPQPTPEADFAVKVDGCTVLYISIDDLKNEEPLSRQTRSVQSGSVLEDALRFLKRHQFSFNRGFHFDFERRLVGLLDIESHMIAGLMFSSRVNHNEGSQDFEVAMEIKPRFTFEAIVGPAASSKRLLQRASTKTAIGMRLRYKQDQLVDFQIDLPMDEMELFRFETQMVEKDESDSYNQYSYLKDSMYGKENIYAPEAEAEADEDDDVDQTAEIRRSSLDNKRSKRIERSIFDKKPSFWNKAMSGKQFFHMVHETSEALARATGLRTKLNVVASGKDLTFLVNCVIKKYDPQMEGYRVQAVQEGQKNGQQHYNLVLSTPGSHIERNTKIRVVQDSNGGRTIIRTELISDFMQASVQKEISFNGNIAVKLEMGARNAEPSYKFHLGWQRSVQPGRIAIAYKPFLLIQTPQLVRPIELQGLISYQQSPKTVIIYELKTSSVNKYFQGKLILATHASQPSKRGQWASRSMSSPLAVLLSEDIVMTNEINAQWKEFALKSNLKVESEGTVFAFDLANTYKTQPGEKPEENRLTFRINYNPSCRSIQFEHRCSTYPVHNFRFSTQYDAAKKQELVQFVGKNTVATLNLDYASKKFELIVDAEGRRLTDVQCRFEKQGGNYVYEIVRQYKSKPMARVQGKVPTMLILDPIRFIENFRNLDDAVLTLDGAIYQPIQAQLIYKVDLKNIDMLWQYKRDDQLTQELKVKYDENVNTFLLDADLKSIDVKTAIKLNMPGLVEAVFGRDLEWAGQGKVEPSSIIYTSRTSEFVAKVLPKGQLTLVIKNLKYRHQTLAQWQDKSDNIVYLKTYTTWNSGRKCGVEIQIHTQRKIIVAKTVSNITSFLATFNLPEKKVELTIDIDGVHVFSHESKLENANQAYDLKSNSQYYDAPYRFSGKIPAAYIDEPRSLLRMRRNIFSQNEEPAEFGFESKQTQMKVKINPGREIFAVLKTPQQQHEAHFEMKKGSLNIVSGDSTYQLKVEANPQQKQTLIQFSTKRVAVRLNADLEDNKVDLVVELDGRQIVSNNNSLERQGNRYLLNIVAKYENQPLVKISGYLPAMLVEEPARFFETIDSQPKTDAEFEIHAPHRAQWAAKVDFQKKDLVVVAKCERKNQTGELKAKWVEKSATIVAEATFKKPSGDAKAHAKINMPGLVKSWLPQQWSPSSSSSWKKSQRDLPSWLEGPVEPSELVYNSRDTQLKARLTPGNDLTVSLRSPAVQHQSRLDLNPSNKIFKFKSETTVDKRSHCNAEIELNAERMTAVAKVSYRETEWQVVCNGPSKTVKLYVEVDGQRVMNHEAHLVRRGNFYVVDSQIDYKQQPYATLQAKIPAMYIDEPSSIWKNWESIQEQTEISYESKDAQMKLELSPRGELVAVVKTDRLQHQTRAQAVDGVYKLKSNNQWKNGSDYELELEYDDQQQQNSFFKAINKSNNKVLAHWNADRRKLVSAY